MRRQLSGALPLLDQLAGELGAVGVAHLDLDARRFRNLVVAGFKGSFFPGTYAEKRRYVRRVINRYEELLAAGQSEEIRQNEIAIPDGPRLGNDVVTASGELIVWEEGDWRPARLGRN